MESGLEEQRTLFVLSFEIASFKVLLNAIQINRKENNNESEKGMEINAKWKIRQNGKWWKGLETFPMIFFLYFFAKSNQLLYTKT